MIISKINIFVLNSINFSGGFRGPPLGERGMVKTIWNKLAEPRGKAFPLNIKNIYDFNLYLVQLKKK